MELAPSLTVILLRSLDVHNPLQIFSIGDMIIGDQYIMVQSAVRSVFIMDDSPRLPHVMGLTSHPSQPVCHKSQFHLDHFGSVMMHQC